MKNLCPICNEEIYPIPCPDNKEGCLVLHYEKHKCKMKEKTEMNEEDNVKEKSPNDGTFKEKMTEEKRLIDKNLLSEITKKVVKIFQVYELNDFESAFVLKTLSDVSRASLAMHEDDVKAKVKMEIFLDEQKKRDL